MSRTFRLLFSIALIFAVAGCVPNPKEQFASYEQRMRDRGLFRTERIPDGFQYDNETLAENFRKIAFFAYPGDERRVAKKLTKWDGALKYAIIGDQSAEIEVSLLFERLAMLTGLEIQKVDVSEANFRIAIPPSRDSDWAARQPLPAKDLMYLSKMVSSRADCFSDPDWSNERPEISHVWVYLHGDLIGKYRTLCLQEEISQSLGLFNDDPSVKPSIFNDDSEFIVLTEHDELLLRVLYDQRLIPGMDANVAMPIVQAIIAELRPGE